MTAWEHMNMEFWSNMLLGFQNLSISELHKELTEAMADYLSNERGSQRLFVLTWMSAILQVLQEKETADLMTFAKEKQKSQKQN